RYTELYYQFTPEVAMLAATNSTFRAQFLAGYQLWKGAIADLVSGGHGSEVVTQPMIDGLLGVVHTLESLGSPELKATLLREEAAFDLPSLAGKTFDQYLAA